MKESSAPAARGPERFSSAPEPESRPSTGRALLAGLALLVLLVGVPVALWQLAGPPPVPTGWPDRADLTQPVGTEVIITVLLAVVWLAWLQFAVCTVVELVSFVRGGGLPRAVPFSGPSQAVARALVGTLLVGTSLLAANGPAAAAAVAPSGPTDTQSVVAQDRAEERQERQEQRAEQQQREQRQERQMLPVAGVPSDMTDVIGHKVAIVQPPSGHYHDNLWDIAERHLGDGRRWKEIFELNQGRVQPDGGQLVLGRLIQPGWVLKMPNDATGVERVEAAPPGPAESPRGDRGERGGDRGAEGGTDTAVDADQLQDGSSSLAQDLTAGGLLAAAVLGALLLERRRRRGQDLDAEEQEAEVALRVGADLDRANRLDDALRSLSAACRAGSLPLPPVHAASVDDERIELHVTGAQHEAPGGWRVEDDGRRWVLERDQSLPAERAHAPYPGLVCLGRDDAGRDVLVDLEAADGAVSVDGSPALAREVVAALAVQLATAPWADEQVVLGHELGDELADLAQDRIELVSDLEATVAGLVSAGVRAPAGQVLAGRLGRTPGQPPRYLVLGSGATESVVEQLVGRSGTRGLGVLVAGGHEASRWRASVDDAGRLTLPLLGIDVDAVRLTPTSAELLGDLFDRARTPRPEPVGGRPPVPPTPDGSGDDGRWGTAPVRVGVLGSLLVQAPGDLDESRLALARELVTFLALQTEPVHPSVVAASVWPMGVTPAVRDATVARVRDWLGDDSEGNHLLRETDSGRLVLSPQVAVDWYAVCELLRRSRDAGTREEPELLRRALQLVRGPLLADVPARRYAWTARTGLAELTVDLVEDAAHRLAELSHDDPPGAVAAVEAGLRLAPLSQPLWRDLLEATARSGDADAVRAAAEAMLTRLSDAGAPVEAETEALLEELLPDHHERGA